MIRLRHRLFNYLFRLGDQTTLILAGLGIMYLRPEIMLQGGDHILEATFHLSDTVGVILLGIGWIGIFEYFVRYKGDRLIALNTQVKGLIQATGMASLWLMLICGLFSVKSFNAPNLFIFFGGVTTTCIFTRLLSRGLLLSARRSGYNSRFLLVVGANDRALAIAQRIISKKELGYRIVGFVAETEATFQDWKPAGHTEWPVLGVLVNLRSILTRERVDEIVVCMPVETRFSDITMIVRHARDLRVVVRLIPSSSEGTLLKGMYVEEFDNEYVVTLFRERLLAHLLAKRLIDASVAIAVLLVLLPLMLSVALLIKISSPGPVLFVQNRVGMNQRQFRLYKFRSMVADAELRRLEIEHLNERDGPAFKIENDPRITSIGRIIRRTSIDELPQLFNVLSGEMSLVGPRPPLPEEVKSYEWLFRKRLSVKPGITCIWQVSGRNNVSFDRWMQMDHEYVENWSVWLDLKILLRTVPAVLLSRGAS